MVYTNENQAIEIDVLDNDFGCELTLSGASNPENGTVEFNADGTVVYTPNEGFSGTDYFYYQACDCSNNCDETLVAVNVLADTIGNLAPIAVSDVAATDGNTPVTINVLANDVDPNGDPLTVTATIDPEHGTVVINADGTITYTPDEGFAGCDIFGYVVCDNAQPALCDTAYVVIEVATEDCANQAPIADNEIITVIVDTPIDIAVLEGDGDPDGDDLIIVTFTEPLHGTVVLDTLTGVFTYTPDPGYEGNDQFTYIVCDNGNPVLCDTAYVSISVQTDTTQNIVDAQPDVVYTSIDQPIVIDVLANDFGDDISITNIVTQPTNGGSVGITTDGISYIPAAGFTGTDYFEYEICDNAGNCDVTLVTIYVLPEDSTNVSPNAANDVAETDMDTPICVDVLANDTDGFGGDNLTITNYTQPDAGTVTLDTTTNQLCYTPPAGFMGTVEFSYTICDNGNPELCDTAMVVITVGLGEPSNNPPVAGDDEYTIPMNSTFEIDIVTPNDTDPDGDNLTISFVSDPQGTVTILDDHSISYITPEGFVGTDFFYYVVCDDGNPILCDTAYVTINVLPELQEVIANPDIDYTTVDVPVIIHPMDNDSGSGISIVYVGTPINGGSVIINNGNSVTYTPALGFVGTDAFIYTICDGLNNCDTSLVTVVVLDLNTTNIPPVAVNDVAMTDVDTPLCINVLYNDFDAYGGDVIFINMYDQTTVNGGTITQQSDSILCYTPPAGYVGVDQFTYIICDNGNPIMCDTAYVVIGVGTGELPNNPPVAEDDVAQTYTNIPVTINVLGNDSDPDGDNLIITLLTDPLGTVEIVNGSVLYTPPTGFEGTDYFAYIVCDDGFPEMCDTAYVTINVLPFDPDTTIVTPEDTPDTLCIATIAGTDMPVTSITVIQAPANGTIDFTTDSDSCLIYIPNPNYCGEDAFIIQVCDAMNMCDTLLIGVEITCVEELPIALNDTISTGVGQPIDIWVLENDYDPDGDPIVVVTIITPPTNGTATILNDSTIVYTPNEDFFGQDSLQYVINDDDGSDTAWVFISVDLDPNDVLAINDSVTTQQETPITIAVLGNDIYPEGTTVITIVTQPANGTAAITADGDSITYIPAVGFVGIDSFQYELCVTNATTGETICDTATVYITVTEDEEPLECDVVFANAFSPNGDGTNELWLIENADNLSECYTNQEIQPELMIFNRWGDKVYHFKDYTNTNAWNGKFNNNGEDLPDGTYFYIFRISENDAKDELKQGYIELRR
ncbi:MAG TPA: Ig-like domain-containing protein [Chitinophagales bacterium]|nr:Ig-like domain-containing protein [Chitinophagales bacterium]